jgi:hypothetical protein
MMKKLFYLFLGTMLMLGVSSCGDIIDDNDNFDATLLYGRWQEGTVFERYDESGLGATWDTDDDLEEEEAQLFKWSLDGSTLIHEHLGQFVTVPKVYTVTTLNSGNLTYHDDYGKTHYFSKVD